jgi:antitoxin (DNA-binding transcriptional repressor) of toxin-antitoxin stability system
MNYITTTELRTKSSELIDFLLAGETVDLIHRSSIVGTIIPKEEEPENLTKEDIKKIAQVINFLNLPTTTTRERAKNYHLHLKKKYG